MDPEQAALLYQAQYARIRLAAVAQAVAAWRLYGGVSDADGDRFLRAVLPIIFGSQRAVSALLLGYLQAVVRDATGRARPLRVPPSDLTTEALRGTPADEVYRRPVVEVRRALAASRPFEDGMELAEQRVDQLAETDVVLAQRRAMESAITQEPRILGARRVLTGQSCALCATASTQRYTLDVVDRPRPEIGRTGRLQRVPGLEGGLYPIHVRCVPEGSVVHGVGVRAMTRRWHSGEVVVLHTARGDEVSVTAEHPVLTAKGWVPAHLVGEGDDLIYRPGQQGAVQRVPDEAHGPARAEDLWRALSVQGVLARMPLAPEDLHGQGAHGEVDVVWADGSLAAERNLPQGQPEGDLGLGVGHLRGMELPSAGPGEALLERVAATPSRGVGGGGLSLPLLGAHLGGANLPSLTAPPRFDPAVDEFTLESAPVYAERGLDLIRRLAGEVQLDRVVKSSRVGFRGHVYNLHTDEGWYASSSHIVSNCDCTVAPIIGAMDPGQIINRRLLRDLQATGGPAYWRNHGIGVDEDGVIRRRRTVKATDDEPGRSELGEPLQVATRRHGELGDVLTVADHEFTGPQDIAA